MYVIEIKKVITKYDKSIYGFTENTEYYSCKFKSEEEAIGFIYTTIEKSNYKEKYYFKYSVENHKYNKGYMELDIKHLDRSIINLIVKKWQECQKNTIRN